MGINISELIAEAQIAAGQEVHAMASVPGLSRMINDLKAATETLESIKQKRDDLGFVSGAVDSLAGILGVKSSLRTKESDMSLEIQNLSARLLELGEKIKDLMARIDDSLKESLSQSGNTTHSLDVAEAARRETELKVNAASPSDSIDIQLLQAKELKSEMGRHTSALRSGLDQTDKDKRIQDACNLINQEARSSVMSENGQAFTIPLLCVVPIGLPNSAQSSITTVPAPKGSGLPL